MTEVRGIAGRDEMTGLAQNPLLVRPALRRFMTKKAVMLSITAWITALTVGGFYGQTAVRRA